MPGLWLRLYTEIRNDRKLKRLPHSQRWLWVVILTIAKESPRPGWLLLTKDVPVTIADLADEADITVEEAVAGMDSFTDWKMLEEVDGVWHLINWDKRNYESDTSAERVRRHRENIKQDVTLPKRYSNVTVTPPETETETETDTDQKEKREKEKELRPISELSLTQLYEKDIGRPLSSDEIMFFPEAEKIHGTALVKEAIETAFKRKAKPGRKYIQGILQNWATEGYKTVKEARAAEGRAGPTDKPPPADDKKKELIRSLYAN
ncbi:MAG: DnaD domain protein [Eubacteriales bacterium]|jgi:DnaD/phage-associated family protein